MRVRKSPSPLCAPGGTSSKSTGTLEGLLSAMNLRIWSASGRCGHGRPKSRQAPPIPCAHPAVWIWVRIATRRFGGQIVINDRGDRSRVSELITPCESNLRSRPSPDPDASAQKGGPGLARLLADRARSDRLLDQIVKIHRRQQASRRDGGLRGGPAGAAHKDLEDFLTRMSAAFAPHDWSSPRRRPSTTINGPIRPMPTSSITRC